MLTPLPVFCSHSCADRPGNYCSRQCCADSPYPHDGRAYCGGPTGDGDSYRAVGSGGSGDRGATDWQLSNMHRQPFSCAADSSCFSVYNPCCPLRSTVFNCTQEVSVAI